MSYTWGTFFAFRFLNSFYYRWLYGLTLYFCCFSDTFHAHKKQPSISNSKTPSRISGEVDNSSVVPSDVQMDKTSGGDVFGTGLKNEVGEYNCFLNVIIQVGVS